MEYQVKLPAFEGPFDLLFHLIQKQQIDIWSISISEITYQYLAHLKAMEELNLEVTSEFLVMAATLLRLKSKMLLPDSSSPWEEEESEDMLAINSTEDLIRRVLEYRLYKGAAEFLQDKEQEQKKIFFRSTEKPQVWNLARQEVIWAQQETAASLASIARNLEKQVEEVNTGYNFSVMEEYGLHQKISYITHKLKQARQPLYFNSFVEKSGVSEIVTTFFALLELIHQREIWVYQEKKFGPILIEAMEEGEE